MSGTFIIEDNFLLENRTSEILFHEYAEKLPLIDFHNHIDPFSIAEDFRFENMSQLWINGDPYKHRAMRICGIKEEMITGNSPDKQKFLNWAKIVPQTMGNPLFHWTCLELKRIFGIDEILSAENAEKIWNSCNEKLQEEGMGTRKILEIWNTDVLCTSDSPADDLTAHRQYAVSLARPRMFPSWRGDSLLAFNSPAFPSEIKLLSELVGNRISDLVTYQSAIISRLDYFGDAGCLISDHSLDSGFNFDLPSPDVATKLFDRVLWNEPLTDHELVLLKSYLLRFLGEEYGRRNWVMQLHIGAHRNTSSRLRRLSGPAGGYACIGNSCDVKSLTCFLDMLEQDNLLPGVILYTMNPSDNEVLASLTGSYTQDGIAGKIQMGPAWWYNDHYDGIRTQLKTIANYGLLSRFVGMTTDSRSILSFSRHEYFRRILCNLFGEWIERGQWPNDLPLIGQMVSDIACYNAEKWLIRK